MVLVQPPEDGTAPTDSVGNPSVGKPSSKIQPASMLTAGQIDNMFDDAADFLASELPQAATAETVEVPPPKLTKQSSPKLPVVENKPTPETTPPPVQQTETKLDETQAVDETTAIDSSSIPLPQETATASSEPVEPPPAAPQAIRPGDQWVSPNIQLWQSRLLLAGAAIVGIVFAIVLFGRDAKKPTVTPLAKISTKKKEVIKPTKTVEQLPIKPPPIENPPETPVEPEPTPEVPPPPKPEEKDPPPTKEKSGELPPDMVPPKKELGKHDPDPKLKKDSEKVDVLSPFLEDLPFVLSPARDPILTKKKPSFLLPPLPGDDESKRSRPALPTVNLKLRLAGKVTSVDFRDTPLTDFLQFISDLSTIPITIDPAILRSRKPTAETPITIRMTDATIDKLLHAALATHDLKYRTEEGHLLITSASKAVEKPLSASYDVTDLTGGDPTEMETLSQWITQLIAPTTWSINGGERRLAIDGKQLTITQTPREHDEVKAFFEKLRIARSLAPTSKLETHRQQTDAVLRKPLTMILLSPTPISEIFRRIHKETGVRIVVDWKSAAELGWPSSSNATLAANNQPLEAALISILKPLGLRYRVIDSHTIQITTAKILLSQPELEFYPVNELLTEKLDAPALVARVKSKLGEHLFLDYGGSIFFDPPSRHLLVLLPQPWQFELEKHLAEWRAGTK